MTISTKTDKNEGDTCDIVSPFSVILFDSGGLSMGLQQEGENPLKTL